MPDQFPSLDPAELIQAEGEALTRKLAEIARQAITDALDAGKPVTVADVVAVLEGVAATLPGGLAAVIADELPLIAERAVEQAEIEIADAREESGQPFPPVTPPPAGDYSGWTLTAVGALVASLSKRAEVVVGDARPAAAMDAGELSAAILAELDEDIRKAVDVLFDTMCARTVSESRMEVFRANADIVQKVKVVTVADAKRSKICAHMNGATFDPKRPVPTPPYHAGCRSYLRAITTAKRKKNATDAEIYRQNWAIYRRLEREAKAAQAEGRANEVLELRFAPTDLDGTAGTFKGIASAYGILDAHGTEFRAGAFTASLAERRATGQRIPILLHHDPRRVAGVVTDIADTPQGLMIEGRFITDTADGREGYALAKAGGMALSVGFKRLADLPRSGGGRTITKANLAEVSLVAIASNPRTKILEVRAEAVPDAAPSSQGDIRMTTKATTTASDETAATETTTTETRSDNSAETRSALDAVNKRLDKLEARSSRAGLASGNDNADVETETRAFSHFIRQGREAMGADEIRSLRVADDVAGGFTAPSEFRAELLRKLVEASPIRSVATVTATGAGELILPKQTGTPTAAWVGETEARSGTEPTFGQVSIPAHEAAVYVDVSVKLLEDSAINIESELSSMLAEEYGRLEGVAFTKGDGVKKPRGIISHPDFTTMANGSTSALDADKIIALVYSLPAAYRRNGAFLANGSTIAAVRSLKSATSGEYLFKESLADGVAGTLLGYPITEIPDLDSVASGKVPLLFGDWKAAYRVVDRVGLSLLRDVYSVATSGLVRIHSRRRVGGDLVRPEAVKGLKMSNS